MQHLIRYNNNIAIFNSKSVSQGVKKGQSSKKEELTKFETNLSFKYLYSSYSEFVNSENFLFSKL